MKQLVEVDNSQQKQDQMKEQIDNLDQIEKIRVELDRVCERIKQSDEQIVQQIEKI